LCGHGTTGCNTLKSETLSHRVTTDSSDTDSDGALSFTEMLRAAAVAGGGPLVVLFVVAQLVLIVIGVFFYSRARLAVQTEIDRKMRAASNQHKLKDLG
jgi:hypothetical protein